MKPAGYPDCLVVINGPEDGAEFPIVRAPFTVGSDRTCGATVVLDTGVRAFHALVSVVSDGYRVRRLENAPVYVNGKRAGMIRSRVVRSGGTVQVGQTLFALECAPDGLASRSRGLVTESDLAWFLRFVGRKLAALIRGAFSIAVAILGRFLGSPTGVIVMLALLYFLWPAFHRLVNGFVWSCYEKLIAASLEKVLQFLQSLVRSRA